jgi:hypothetical protein
MASAAFPANDKLGFVDTYIAWCKSDDKLESFFTSSDGHTANPLTTDTTEIQRQLNSIPCLETLINSFNDLDLTTDPEPLDRAIGSVIQDAPVIQVAAILFAGRDILAAITVTEEHPVIMLLHYVVTEEHVADVDFYMDYLLYSSKSRTVVRMDTTRPLKTHNVTLEGMCITDEQTFLGKAERVRSRNVAIE